MAATVTVGRGKAVSCRIVDIGAAGCRIRTTEAAWLSGPVTLEYQGQITPAQVVWAEGDLAGLWFPNVKGATAAEPGILRRLWGQLSGR